jgi:hypothetical protein
LHLARDLGNLRTEAAILLELAGAQAPPTPFPSRLTAIPKASSRSVRILPILAAWASSAGPIEVRYDGMHVAVPESSTSPGTGIIQWNSDGGSEQNWYLDQVYDPNGNYLGDFLRNQNSNLCIQTNGFAGATLYQEPCNPTNGLMVWMPHYGEPGDPTYVTWTNEAAGLNLDVYGNSYGGGANIDGWYPNGGANQDFPA